MTYQPKSYRKFVATAATATLVASAIAPAASAATFTDVSDRYKEAVDYLVANGVTQGTDEGRFGTADSIKRVDAAIMVARLLDLDGADAPDAGFTDVPDRAQWAVNALKEADIINGKTATRFGSQDSMTRAEMAKVIAKAYELTGSEDLPFSDVSATFEKYVKAIYEAGITQGKTDTQFGSDQDVTRGEFALFVHRAEMIEDVMAPEVASAMAIDANKVAVTFNTDVTEYHLKASNFKVSNLSVTDVSVNGKVATLTLSSELTNGTTYTVTATGLEDADGNVIEDSSSNFLYAVEFEKGISLTKKEFVRYANQDNPNIFDFVEVKDQNGKAVPESQIAAKNVETDVATVVSTASATKGDLLASGTANVNIKYTLADGTIVETGTIQIKVTNQDASNTAGFSINSAAYDNTVAFKNAEAVNMHKTILYPGQGTGKALSAYAYDSNKDPLTEAVGSTNSEKVSYTVTSGDTLFQVNKDTGAVIYQAPKAGKATVQVKKGSFSYDAQVELRDYAKLNNVTSNKSSLTIAEAKSTPAEQTATSLQTASLDLTLLDQYSTPFGTEDSNRYNGTAATIAAGSNVTNDAGTVVGQSSAITYASKTGKIVATADSNKVGVTIGAGGTVTVTPKVRDISSDETVNLTLSLYDTTSNSDGTLLKTVTVPVTIKNITEATAQKVMKASDMDASGAVDPMSAVVTLWEVDVDGDKIKPVKQGVPTVNRGADLASTADDVTLSSNEVIEFEGVFENAEVDRFVKEKTATYDPTNVKADNKVTITTGNANATAEFEFNDPATTGSSVASLFGYDKEFTVKAKTSDSTTSNYLVAQTINLRAYNSNKVAMSANIASTTTVDMSKVNEILGNAAATPISIKDSVLGLYDKSEFIIDKIGTTDTTIALMNGEDGAVISPVVSLKDQDGNPLWIGPKAYGETVTNTFASSKNDAVKGGTQKLQFTATLLDSQNVALSSTPAIGAPLTGSETVTLDADKEQGSVKVLLTGIYRDNDFPSPYKKNLLAASQIVTITYTK
ncbi:S-layer homology domain-containing protein [Bacillus sp. MCCB 382]|uniref:S-layer homology domain-containing protein n=1 Tax=Bacillus sp. MCCB 382 TaxID=2860197 RepID=UPI001C561717|nr:S-layer homology domain-containing protein [Bacillus sp. MCCB 382]